MCNWLQGQCWDTSFTTHSYLRSYTDGGRAGGKTGPPQRLSGQRCGVVWEISSGRGSRSVLFYKEQGLTWPPHSFVFIVQPGAWGPSRPPPPPGSCEEGNGGEVWRKGERTLRTQDRVNRTGWEAAFPPIRDAVCIMTSCSLHCYFSQHHGLTIPVASHKRKKRNPWFTFSLQKCSFCLSAWCCPVFLIFHFGLHDPSAGRCCQMCIH